MLKKELQRIGLNEKEAKVYLALLELGEAQIQLITERSRIKRTTVYNVLRSLKEQGLVGSLFSKKKIFYFPENPKIFKEKNQEKEKVIDNLIPELLSITNLASKKPVVKFFEGREGVKNVFLDSLNYPNQKIDSWFPKIIEKFYQDFLNDHYTPKRIEKKIWVRTIAPKSEMIECYAKLDKNNLRRIRMIPEERFPFEIGINLYGKNKIGILSYNENFGLIIESQSIFNSLEAIFEMNWAMLD